MSHGGTCVAVGMGRRRRRLRVVSGCDGGDGGVCVGGGVGGGVGEGLRWGGLECGVGWEVEMEMKFEI